MKDSDRVYPRLNDQVVILILLACMSTSAHLLQKTLDHVGKGAREDGNERRSLFIPSDVLLRPQFLI